MAGPSERAGLMEHPSIGSSTVWAQKTAKPIASGASICTISLPDTAVSSTTSTSTNVITISPHSALPMPTPLVMELLPRVDSLPFGMVAIRKAAPMMAPMTCAMELPIACIQDSAPASHKPKVTAGFIWPPDRPAVAYASTACEHRHRTLVRQPVVAFGAAGTRACMTRLRGQDVRGRHALDHACKHVFLCMQEQFVKVFCDTCDCKAKRQRGGHCPAAHVQVHSSNLLQPDTLVVIVDSLPCDGPVVQRDCGADANVDEHGCGQQLRGDVLQAEAVR
mmetsp:Transcript_25650/g.75920  ORF Transcript_25650/g.75920 Transcript_25650/m.75920 type:complete len:278 (-) Transcript_25650:208-1041(-)